MLWSRCHWPNYYPGISRLIPAPPTSFYQNQIELALAVTSSCATPSSKIFPFFLLYCSCDVTTSYDCIQCQLPPDAAGILPLASRQHTYHTVHWCAHTTAWTSLCLSSSHIELPWARADADDEPEDAQPKTKKETRWGWELLNDNKAIWLRSAGDVEEEEYVKFYQALSKVCLCAFRLVNCLTVRVFVPVCICLSLCLSVCLVCMLF